MDAEEIYEFAPFRLMVGRRVLLREEEPVSLGARAFDVLVSLVRRRGELAARAALMEEVWPDTIVEENNLNTQIVNLRKVFGDTAAESRFIVTIPGRGFRFAVPVSVPLPDAEARPATVTPPLEVPAALAPPQPERHNLPIEPNSFIGREAELADIWQRMDMRKLMTLVGSGGVGKTRIALHLALAHKDRFRDGVWLVELAPLADPTLVAEALCRVIGAPVSGDRPAADIAAAFLRGRETLLILDNCEHVLQATARLAAALLGTCPDVAILATSRQKLGIPGETVYRLPSLPVPELDAALTAEAALRCDSVRLFVERANDAVGGFELTDEDAPAIATICRRLDGVPMATELAAARLRMLKPAEIAARLEDVFRLLTGGSTAALPRQQTLRATIDWSHNLLSEAEQIVLRRLAVFVDGFSLDGASAVAAGGPIHEDDVMDLVSGLVDKSLVSADTGGTVTRYRMLETTRHYAGEKLAASRDTGRRRRMAEYLAGFYARAEEAWSTTATEAWLEAYGPEVVNLRSAVDWAFTPPRGAEDPGDPALGITLVAYAGDIAEEMSLQGDMRRWTAAAIRHVSPATDKAQAGWVLYWAQRHQGVFGAGELSEARRRTIALFREAGNQVGLACALRGAALAMARPRETGGEAFALMGEAVGLLRARGPSKDLAAALGHLGSLHYFNGQHEEARRLNEEALDMRKLIGDRSGILASYINLAELEAADLHAERAIGYTERAETEARRCNALALLAVALGNLAGYSLMLGDKESARRNAMEALRLNRMLGFADYAVLCLEHLALTAALEGEFTEAAVLVGHTEAYFDRTGQMRDRLEQAGFERLLALLRDTFAPDALAGLLRHGSTLTADAAADFALDPAA